MSRLCYIFRASLVLFSSCKSSDLNSRPCSSFSRTKRIKTNHIWTTPSSMFLLPVSLSSCTSRFLSFQIFSLLFSCFLSFLFFVFDISFGSTLTFFKSLCNVFKKLLIFREISHPLLGRHLWFLVLFLTSTFSWGYENDLEDFAPLQQILRSCLKLTAMFYHMAPFPLLSLTFTFKYIVARNCSHHMNALFVVPRHDRPKERVKQTISLQVIWNIVTKGYMPRDQV